MITNHRDPVPDFMKGVAVIFMIQVHIVELFARPEILGSMTGRVSLFLGGPPAAPVFMTVMGYYIAASSRNFSSKLIRGLKILMLGFLLNIGLNLNLFIHYLKGIYEIDPWQYLLGVDIFILAGLSICLIALIERVFKESPWPYFGLAILIALLSGLLTDLPPGTSAWKYLEALFRGPYEWSYFPVFPWLAYPLAGYALFLSINQWTILPGVMRKYRWPALFLCTVILSVTFPYSFRVATDLQVYYHHDILFFGWNLLFLCWWWLVSDTVILFAGGQTGISFIRMMGREVTAAYIIQWLIIGNIATEIYKTQFILPLIFWFAGITGITYLLVMIYKKSASLL